MKNQKTFFQKAVEKMVMLERNDSFAIMPGDTTGDGFCDALFIGLHTGGGFTPLAKLLSSRDCQAVTPDFETAEMMGPNVRAAKSKLTGIVPEDFEENPQLEELNKAAIDKLRLS